MGLEPTRPNGHKILSLARLPIPTLPHVHWICTFHAAKNIIAFLEAKVNGFLIKKISLN